MHNTVAVPFTDCSVSFTSLANAVRKDELSALHRPQYSKAVAGDITLQQL